MMFFDFDDEPAIPPSLVKVPLQDAFNYLLSVEILGNEGDLYEAKVWAVYDGEFGHQVTGGDISQLVGQTITLDAEELPQRWVH